MMKKLLIIAAVASVALASCTKTVPVAYDDGKDVAISFSPISQRVGTKANVFGEQSATYSATNPSTGKYEDFAAWAYYTAAASSTTNPQTNSTASAGSEFFGTSSAGVACVHYAAVGGAGTDYWAPTTQYYWPKTGYLHFHAMSPAVLGSGTLTHAWATGIQIDNYVAPQYTDDDTTVDQAADNQIDLMYSDFVFDQQRSSYDVTGATVGKYDDDNDSGDYKHDGVNLLFRHALSLVQFKVKTEADYKSTSLQHEFYVKKIEVLNAYNTGDFQENRKNDLSNGYIVMADMTDKIGLAPDNSGASGTPYWSDFDNEVTLTPYDVTTGAAGDRTEATENSDSPLLPRQGQVGTTLITLPQALLHSPNHVQVRVTYDYRFSANNGTNWTESNNQTITVDLSGAKGTYSGGTPGDYTVSNWLINHKYVYTLVFKLDPIIFDPAVAAFVEVSDIGVDLPIQN